MPNPIDDLGCTQAAVHESGVGFAIFDQQDVAHSSTVEAVLPAAIVPSLVSQLGQGMGYSPYACCDCVPTSSNCPLPIRRLILRSLLGLIATLPDGPSRPVIIPGRENVMNLPPLHP